MENPRIRALGQPLFRMIIPKHPELNIFSGIGITALGPIMVATMASKLPGWQVEVIDENLYTSPRDSHGLPDHQILQKLNPATVVGFYCGLTSTMERVWDLAEFYHQQGSVTIAGAWHSHYCPEETLAKNIDIVVHGAGEYAIGQILRAIASGGSIENIPGISFIHNEQTKTNEPKMIEIACQDDLPRPDFGLLTHAKRIKYYSISRIRGCNSRCEFCSVNGKPNWASAYHLFETVNWLVDSRRAKKFFIVDDNSGADIPGTIEFFKLIAQRYGKSLKFTVQVRLEAAANTKLLEVMKSAGVAVVCIGYESPIDEDLKAMHKGYQSSQMLKWTKVYRSYGFRIHAMFIFGYPAKDNKSQISALEMEKRFKRFIRQAHFDTIQVLHPVPIVGTALRDRLMAEGRVFPLDILPYSCYDGSWACFRPDNMTVQELQEIPTRIMKWFYSFFSFLRIPFWTIIFPFDYLVRGWERWRRHWYRDVVKGGGHILLVRWRNRHKGDIFLKKLQEYISAKK